MALIRDRSMSGAAWALAARQNGVVSGGQLRALGFTAEAIQHRIERGRLHPLWRGVFAVGRRDVSERGLWRAATLACGEGAVLSHESAAALWGIRPGGHDADSRVSSGRAREASRDPLPPAKPYARNHHARIHPPWPAAV